MSTALVIRVRRPAASPLVPNERGHYSLLAEHPWAIEGSAELIAGAFAAFRSRVATLVHAEILHLDFGNTVGVFRVPGLGTLEVASGKWDERHFDGMLADVSRIASALPFASTGEGALPFDRAIAAREDLLYHAFVYIRHILGTTAPADDQLLPALSVVLADPHRRTTREAHVVPTESVRHVDHATLEAIARGSGAMMRVSSDRLPPVLRGLVPLTVPERRVADTVDTPENRFVKAFLDTVVGILEQLRRTATSTSFFDLRIRQQSVELAQRLAPVLRHPLWKQVGTMRQLPVGSTVLQRRRGYRDVLRHFTRLRLATRHLPLSLHETKALLESKDIAVLYELWCFFEVVDAVQSVLESTPTEALRTEPHPHDVKVREGCVVMWADGTKVAYNQTFDRKSASHRSWSVELRPDVIIVLPDGSVHVLDAKFKREPMKRGDERTTVAKNEDIIKMHAYRDALEKAASAWVLYPGETPSDFTPPDAGDVVAGVGAIPLRPEQGGNEHLRKLVRRILAR